MYSSAQDLDYYTILLTELPEKFGDKKKASGARTAPNAFLIRRTPVGEKGQKYIPKPATIPGKEISPARNF